MPTTDYLTVAKAPCKSCPYRLDVPSGVWAETEYDKLPGYDGDMLSQLEAGATGVFMCHQNDGNLCAGWLGCHHAFNLLALRYTRTKLARRVWDYVTTVPLWASGAEAAKHGKRAIRRPSVKAKRTIDQLLRKRERPSR